MRPVSYALGLGLLLLTAPAGPAADGIKAPPATAWGRPVGKLQAGVRLKPGGPTGGSVVELQVVVRNVGRGEAAVRHMWLGGVFSGAAREGVVSGQGMLNPGGFGGSIVASRLAPGAEQIVGHWPVLRPRGPGPDPFSLPPVTRLLPGTYQFGIDRFELGVGVDDVVELGTGYLDVVVPPAR